MALHTIGVQERGEVWVIVGKFGFVPGLRGVRASLLSVRRANRDVEGSVGVAEGGGEDTRGSQVGAKDEPRNPSLWSQD